MSIPPRYANKTFKSCCFCKPTTVFIFCRDEAGNDITDFAVLREFYDKIEHKIEDYQLKRKGQPDFPARVGMQMMGWSAEQPIKSVIEYFNLDFQFAKSPEEVFPFTTCLSTEKTFSSLMGEEYGPCTKIFTSHWKRRLCWAN